MTKLLSKIKLETNGRQWIFTQIRGYLSPGTMFEPMQGAYEKEAMAKESVNVNPSSVQKAYRPLRACKLLLPLQRRTGPSMEICANSGLLIAR